jgi:hypothetical protein
MLRANNPQAVNHSVKTPTNMDKEKIILILIVLAVILVVALVVNLAWRRDIVSTYKALKPGKLMALKNMICAYYLPETILKIETVAEILISYGAGGAIVSKTLIRQDFKISTYSIADSAQPYFLKYNPNPFASDEVKIAVNDKGLLETVKVISDDQTDQIISLITAPPKPSREEDDKRGIKGPPVRSEVRKFESTFEVHAWETTSKYKKEVPWAPMESINAGFQLTGTIIGATSQNAEAEDATGDKQNSEGEELSGILFRTRSHMELTVESLESKQSVSTSRISVINKDREFIVPLLRAPFVKRTHDVSIKNGELASHHLISPSPAKGFISIPIDLAKAIVSIPARLISLRIDMVGKRKELESAKYDLTQVQEKSRKFEEERARQDKELVDIQKKLVMTQAELAQTKVDSLDEIARLEREIQKLQGKKTIAQGTQAP